MPSENSKPLKLRIRPNGKNSPLRNVRRKSDRWERFKILPIVWRGQGYKAWTKAGGTLRKSRSQRRKLRLLYPYLQKQVGGEGVNLGAVLSLAAIFVVLGGWLAWASGVGGKPMPSIRANMTATAGARVEVDLGAPFT